MSFLFGKDHEEEELGIIERLLRVNEKLVTEITRLKPICPAPRFIAFFSIHKNKSKFLIMSLTLNKGDKVVVGIQVIDSITGSVLGEAKLSGQQYVDDNLTSVGATPDADGASEDLEALDGGLANLSGSVTADLSAYGLGSAVVLPVAAVPVNVITPVTVAPLAQFVFSPVTPATAPATPAV